MSTNENKTSLTLIGLGPMGQAMVRTYLDNGVATTVWNRTASRADTLVEAGAIRAASVAEAVAANKLIILSLTDYRAMYDILGTAEEALDGRVIVNISSDSPDKTREAAKWLKERGAELIAGGIMVPSVLVGKEESFVFYSGPREVFDAYEPTLRLIGRPDYRGEDPGLAQLFYQSQLDMFLTSLSAYLHAVALVGSAGVSAETYRPYAEDLFNTMSMYLEQSAQFIDAGEYPGDQANVKMMGATADHIVEASREAGIETGLPAAVKAQYDRAIAAGRGGESWESLIELIKKPATG